jgi:uncharacterized protein (DUF1778 family)
VNAPEKSSWPVVGTRAHPDDIKLIDRAALEMDMKRGPFMLQAALKEAHAVLGAIRHASRKDATPQNRSAEAA